MTINIIPTTPTTKLNTGQSQVLISKRWNRLFLARNATAANQ